ncbi:MAG: hypothetical protein JNM07_10295 [Phycisphaerae bacterium]|nr:hypothetical protein [Phycisphaerae bacterium]
MVQRLVVRAACAAVLASATTAARADFVIDQDNLITASGFAAAFANNVEMAQTFRVGRTGRLAAVDLQVWRDPGADQDVILRVRRAGLTASDPPTADILYTRVIPAAMLTESVDPLPNPLPAPLRIDIPMGAVAVSEGDRLAITLERGGRFSPPWAVWASAGPTYALGSTFQRNPFSGDWLEANADFPYDVGFATYVVPGPSVAMLLVPVALGRAARRARNVSRAATRAPPAHATR